MSVVAEGFICLALTNLRSQLSSCARFQTWCGADSDAEASARIHIVCLPPPRSGGEHTREELETFRPYVLLSMHSLQMSGDSGGAHLQYIACGTIELHFEQDVPEALRDTHSDLCLTFLNDIGVILDEFFNKCGAAGGLSVLDITWRDAVMYRSLPRDVPALGDAIATDFGLAYEGL